MNGRARIGAVALLTSLLVTSEVALAQSSARVDAESPAEATASCVPACRSGYVCNGGECVSACNSVG